MNAVGTAVMMLAIKPLPEHYKVTVDWSDILDKITVEHDPYSGEDWEEGVSVEFISSSNLPYGTRNEWRERDNVFHVDRSDYAVVTIDDKVIRDHVQWYREAGASKHFAYLKGRQLRASLLNTVRLKLQGDIYPVIVSYGDDIFSDCLGGEANSFDVSWENYLREEVAANIACQMEEEGFEITGRPDQDAERILSKIKKMRENVNTFNHPL
jgi:hypothetical protein